MYQSITIVGNLGNDPDMRYLGKGTPVTSFSVATNRRYTDAQGNPVEEVTWFRVTAWAKLAETTNQYLRKGARVLVEGALTPDPETGGPKVYARRDGTSGASFEVRASEVRFLSSRDDDAAHQPRSEQGGSNEWQGEGDEIPF